MMRKTRKYKRRTRKKRTRKKRGGMDPPKKLQRSSSAPSASIYEGSEFPTKEEMENSEFLTPRAKDPEKAISIPKPRRARGPVQSWGDAAKGVGQFMWIISGGPNRKKQSRAGGKPAKAGISMCIWYGAGNKSSAVDRCDSLMDIGPDKPTYKKVFPVAIKKNWMGVPYLDDKFNKSVPTTDKGTKLPKIYDDLTPFTNKAQTGIYDAYYIIYEEKCGHGGERFELMKLDNVNIQNLGMGNGHKIQYKLWNDDMMVKENGNLIDIKWGSSKYKRPVGTIWINQLSDGPERRHSVGGKRRRKRKRKTKTRKKRRKKGKKTRRRK